MLTTEPRRKRVSMRPPSARADTGSIVESNEVNDENDDDDDDADDDVVVVVIVGVH